MGREHEKARARYAAAQTITEAEAIKADVRKGEEIYGQVSSLLGAAGTYPGSPGYQGPTISGPQQPTSIMAPGESGTAISQIKGKDRARLAPKLAEQARGVDVGAAVGQITGSTQFQIASQLTAEAQQMINREGPLYERMKTAMTNPILARGAQAMEDSLDEISKSFASGGRARREGLRDALKMQAQLETNEQVSSALVQANYQMDSWARDNARATLQFNQTWASNQAGVRQVYMANMSAARGFMASMAVPSAANYQKQADAINQTSKKNWVQVGLGAVMAVAGAATGNVPLIAAGAATAAGGTAGGGGGGFSSMPGLFGGGTAGSGQNVGGGGISAGVGTASKAG